MFHTYGRVSAEFVKKWIKIFILMAAEMSTCQLRFSELPWHVLSCPLDLGLGKTFSFLLFFIDLKTLSVIGVTLKMAASVILVSEEVINTLKA